MRLSTYRWLVPVPACFALQTSFGSFYATGVFSSRLHDPLVTYALGYSAAFLSVSLTAAGIILHRRPPPNSPARSLALLSAALLAVAAFLPAFSSPTSPTGLLYAASAALGSGYGVLYVVSISVLQAWVPDHPGTATGALVSCGGAGTLFYIALNTSLCGMYANDIPRAMRTSAAIQTAVALISAAAVSMPPSPSWTPEKKGSPRVDESIANEGTPLIEDSPSSPQSGFPSATYLSIEPDHSASSFSSRMEKDAISLSEQPMTTSEMMQYPAFYALLATVTSSVGPGFGVVLHGSRMQTVLFGVKPAEADKRFFFVTLVGVVGRLLVGMAVDVYGLARAKSAISKDYRNRSTAVENAGAIFELDGGPTKYAFEGAKVINAALLVLQTVALALVFIFIPRGFATLFVIAISAIYLTFSGAAVLMACLCRAVFMPINSTLAFSLIGLAIGMGDVVFSSLVASCSENNPLAQNMLSPSSHLDPSLIHSHAGDYNPYFITSLVFSILGLASALWLTPAKRPL